MKKINIEIYDCWLATNGPADTHLKQIGSGYDKSDTN
jgi:hypothetical protein